MIATMKFFCFPPVFILGIIILLLSRKEAFVAASSSSTGCTKNNIRDGPVFSRRKTTTIPKGGAAAMDVVVTSSGGGPFQTFLATIKESRKHLAAAAVARSVSISGIYPVDTIKTRIQLQTPNAFTIKGLYGGLGGSLIGQVPYGVLTFGSYEMYKRALLDKFPNIKPAFIYAMSAILGDVTGSGWLCPSEVVKQQMQAGMYSTTKEAVQSIWQKSGINGFYQGYFGGLARDVPFRVAQLTSYEITKNIYLKMKTNRQQRRQTFRDDDSTRSVVELSPVETALCGAVAGSFSAAITNPLDRIKTMLMTNGDAYGGSVLSCASRILSNEGIKGFTTGIVPRVLYIAPSVAVFFVAYEATQQRLKHWK